MMRRLFDFLRQAWVLTLIATLLLALLVWHEGPLFSYDGSTPLEDSGARWRVVFVLLVLWALFWLWRIAAEKLASLRLARVVAGDGEGAAAAPGDAEVAAERAVLAARLQDALEVLRRARHDGSGHILYRLPWYMIIGASGTGKSTLLAHSGLHFPLAARAGRPMLAGVGSTRHCDWWFTEEAVLIDTAGRYATQDSDATIDGGGWLAFLDMLRRQRKRQPINGVLVAVSAADLLQKDAAARQALAQSLRARIKELHEQLGIRFPLYLLVTKCDLLAGFMEFFDADSSEEQAQVWGMTFALAPSTAHEQKQQAEQALASFTAEFDALELRLQGRVLERMQHERDLQRRALVHGFPQQFAGLGAPLAEFLETAFAPSPFEEAAQLRGVYFTSGTQEGNPIDRVIGALAQAFGLDRQALPSNSASGRSFFLTRLLREVVFREAGLAGTNLRLERHRRVLQWACLALLAGFLVFVLSARGISFYRNLQLVENAATHVARLEDLARATPRGASLADILPMLDAARALPTGYDERGDKVPTLMRIGLYQGKLLAPAANGVYERLLREALLPRLLRRLESQLRRGAALPADTLHETLRHYLMLGERKRFDANALQAWFELDLAGVFLEADAARDASLARHVAALLETLGDDVQAAHVTDAALVEEARLALAHEALPLRVYARMKRQLGRAPLPAFSLASAAGQGAALVFVRKSGEPLTRGVPGMFTVAGFRKFVEAADQAIADTAADGWVLGKQDGLAGLGDVEALRAAVRELYLADYIREWDGFLADVAVPPFASLDEGARLALLLAGAESPLRKLVTAAAAETHLDGMRVGVVPDSVVQAVKDKLDAYRRRLENTLGNTPPAAPLDKSVNPVDAHFRALQRLAGSAPAGEKAGTPGAALAVAPIDATLALLRDVASYFDEAERARRSGTGLPAGDALLRLKREAQNAPAPLAGILQGLDAAGGGIATGSDRARLNGAWAPLAAFCRQAIEGRYPLVRGAEAEVLPDDFGRFFAAGGMVDDFFQRNLKPYVDTGDAQWRWRPAGAALGIPESVLAEFQRAAAVRDSYFAAGGRQPSMRFEIRAPRIEAPQERLRLEVEGQVMESAAGAAPQTMAFVLPGGQRDGGASLLLAPAMKEALRAEGRWAWLRLLDLGKVEATAQAERYRLVFPAGALQLKMEMSASSVINPFQRAPLENFRCLGSL